MRLTRTLKIEIERDATLRAVECVLSAIDEQSGETYLSIAMVSDADVDRLRPRELFRHILTTWADLDKSGRIIRGSPFDIADWQED